LIGKWPTIPRELDLTDSDDSNNIAAAKYAGMMEDLNLADVDFQTAVSILFVGYVCRSSCRHQTGFD
jgi:hypothetical protein